MGNRIELICFTGVFGGAGCTSSARALARIACKLYKKRVLCLSFDCLSIKMAPLQRNGASAKAWLSRIAAGQTEAIKDDNFYVRDDFGVCYISDKYFFNPLPESLPEDIRAVFEALNDSGCFDCLIIDLPYKYEICDHAAGFCSSIYIVDPYYAHSKGPSMALMEHFKSCLRSNVSSEPRIKIFSPMEDKESFYDSDVDIHGQFGAEVRELASELFDR